MFAICLFRVCRPLIRTIDLLNEPFGQHSFKVTHKDDVVLTVEVYPALIAVLGILALGLTCRCTVEYLVERLLMDIPQYHIKILAERYVTVAMHNEATHDTLAAQPQMSVPPFVIECYEVEVLLRIVDALGNLTDEVEAVSSSLVVSKKAIVP